ncbi:MAG: RNA polymerase sigma factor, partial [Isosphaerales bacterium]
MPRLRGAYSGAVLHQIERLFHQGTSIGATEGELLERFVTRRDETAFEALVARHGPMVLGVCRQLLRDPNDVDDAFQATFLVLVRKAGTLRRRDLLGNWLYGVAYRVAVRARSLSARRMARLVSDHEAVDLSAAQECRQDAALHRTTPIEPEPAPWLHQEVSHLPEKYRIPILLCYFEGLTHDEAATRLGWPIGTVKGRLSRARDLLRKRLSRRGVTLSATALISHLTVGDAKAAVPAFLQLATLNAARALACPAGTSLVTMPAVSLPVTGLVEGVLQAMMFNQVKSVAFSLLFVAGTVATGVVVGGTQLSGRPGDAGKTSQAASADRAERGDPRAKTGQDFRKASRRAPQEAPKSVSAEIVQQQRAAGHSFDNLLSKLSDPGLEDIDRLSRWSNLMLQADLVLGTAGDADRMAAYEAHRDRMKKLYELIQKLPVSPENQPIKADHAHSALRAAEQMLGSQGSSTPGTGMMAGTGMMGGMGQRGMMVPMDRMMGGMMVKNPASAPDAGQQKDSSPMTTPRSLENPAGGPGGAS